MQVRWVSSLTSWYGHAFGIISPFWWESSGQRWIPRTNETLCRVLMIHLLLPFVFWTSCLANNRAIGDSRRHDAQVTGMCRTRKRSCFIVLIFFQEYVKELCSGQTIASCGLPLSYSINQVRSNIHGGIARLMVNKNTYQKTTINNISKITLLLIYPQVNKTMWSS